MIHLLFIRHGATAGNLEKRYIGSTDEPLCDIGIAQVEALKQHNFQGKTLFAPLHILPAYGVTRLMSLGNKVDILTFS